MKLGYVVAVALLLEAPNFAQTAGTLANASSLGTEPAGVLKDRHYHHNLTGVEFDLPPGWSIGITKPIDGNPKEMTVLVDPDARAIFASVLMSRVDTPAASIAGALSRAVPQLLARRAGSLPPHRVPNLPNKTWEPGADLNRR